jgi:iron complex outermembrane recepter protein
MTGRQHESKTRRWWRSAATVAALSICAAHADPTQTAMLEKSPQELKKLSLEELLNIEVTTVSKRAESINAAASSVQVITQEDIRRSGARSLPEALRIAPNLQVAQINSSQWAITARGFNGGTVANKLLVMIDGRSVYTPLFSGVFWDVQDTMLEDVDRIEVISGPGATLWGANAVNGVINIVTKSAADPSAQGLLVSGGGGTEERAFGGIRYGGKLSENASYRVYGKYFNRDRTARAGGGENFDDWHMGQGGFRTDWNITPQNLVTVQGDLYSGEIGQQAPADTTVSGANVLGRYAHTFSDEHDLALQVYYDRTQRHIPDAFSESLRTYDLDFQYRVPLGQRHSFLWGLGYRGYDDHVGNTASLAFLPSDVHHDLYSAFLQDEISLTEEVTLTLGSKFEHNDFTRWELQPSTRLAWKFTERQTVWAAISRAVRSPSRIDRDFFVPGSPPFILGGGPGFKSEELLAYEIGYRARPLERLTTSVAAFYNDYDHIRSVQPGAPVMIANDLEGETYGVEMDATFQACEWWRVRVGFTHLEEDIRIKPGRADLNLGRGETSDPSNQFFLHSWIDLPANFEFDAAFRFIDTLHNVSGGVIGKVPSYAELDVRLGCRVTENLEISIVGQNLLHDQHPEFGFPSASRAEIERGVYGKVTWRF